MWSFGKSKDYIGPGDIVLLRVYLPHVGIVFWLQMDKLMRMNISEILKYLSLGQVQTIFIVCLYI